MTDDFYRRYRRQIEAIYHHTEGHVDRIKIAEELRRYMEEYGIDIRPRANRSPGNGPFTVGRGIAPDSSKIPSSGILGTRRRASRSMHWRPTSSHPC